MYCGLKLAQPADQLSTSKSDLKAPMKLTLSKNEAERLSSTNKFALLSNGLFDNGPQLGEAIKLLGCDNFKSEMVE